MRSQAKAPSAGSTTRQAKSLGRLGIAGVCLFALLAFWGSSAPSALAAVTAKGVNGFFGSTGSAGGQLNTPRGVAVNQSNGNVYLADSSNNRISVFDSSGTFLRAFGQDVVSSGPGNNGTGYEICVASSGDVCKAGITSASTGGAMQNPQGVALDAAGNVYVSEQDKLRVQKFDTNGGFLLAFGKNVTTNGSPSDPGSVTTTEVCSVAADCKAGEAGSLGGEFNSGGTGFNGYPTIASPGAPNAGNVLVADNRNLRIQEFSPAGAFVRAFGFDVKVGGVATFEVCEAASECKIGITGTTNPGQFTNTVNRVAEDADGNIYTVQSSSPFRVQKFTLPGNVVTPQGNFAEAHTKGSNTSTAPIDVAIDPVTKNVLVMKGFAAGATNPCPATEVASVRERRVVEISPAAALEATHMICAGISTSEIPNVFGLAIRGSTGDIYVASTHDESRLYVLNTPTTPTVAFEGIGDIGPHEATVSGFANPNTALPYGLSTGYHINYKRSSDSTFSQSPAVDIDLGKGNSNKLISQKIFGLEAGTSYDIQLVAARPFNGGIAKSEVFSFSTPAALAEVGIPSATAGLYEISATETRARVALWGGVNPNSEETTYRFEYGTTTAYGTKVPAPEESVGSGAGEVPVAQYVDDLVPNTTYHFRLVAKNINGPVASPDRTFTTPALDGEDACPNEAVREQQSSTHLPECRAFEMVSPADKGSSGAVNGGLPSNGGLPFQAAEDGSSFLYPIQNGLPASTAGGWTRWRAARTASGWLGEQLSAPSLIPPPRIDGIGVASPSGVQHASPDLGCSLLETYNPLTEDTPQLSVELGVENLYRRNADGSHDLITDRVPLNPVPFDNTAYPQLEASHDCSRVYFKSIYEFVDGASGIYEWDGETLRDAGVLPNGAVGADLDSDPNEITPAVIGSELSSGTARWNAVTPDGRRLFFTAIANEGPSSGKPAVFMREDGGSSIVEISSSQTAVPTNGARFEAASADGSRVFFRANHGIAGPSTGPTNGSCGPRDSETNSSLPVAIEQRACDLYVYEVESGELTNLSVDPNPADPIGAAIQGAVAIDKDGSHVYFAALGQLVPGKGRTYAQNVAGEGSANLYLSHEGELSYVTTLNRGTDVTGDLFGGANIGGRGVVMRTAGKWSAEASADGRRLVFESAAKLTDHQKPGAGKAVYLYSADTGEIACVSCPLDGGATLVKGNGEVEQVSLNSPFLLATARTESLGFRPSSMSEDGSRVFFTSPDVLVPGAAEGKRNVYEWYEGQVHFLAITDPSGGGFIGDLGVYLDASASGDDVFVATKEQLAPQDVDFISDVYDVRVGGGFAKPVEPPACQVDESLPLLPNQIYCQGEATPQPQAPSPASPGFQGPGNPPESKPRPGACPKGKVRRRGKCVKRPKKAAKRNKRGRAAKTDRGGAA